MFVILTTHHFFDDTKRILRGDTMNLLTTATMGLIIGMYIGLVVTNLILEIMMRK